MAPFYLIDYSHEVQGFTILYFPHARFLMQDKIFMVIRCKIR
mgnify:CR=1 FL=1